MQKRDTTPILLGAMLILTLTALVYYLPPLTKEKTFITGFQTQTRTFQSNVSIREFFAISTSANLSDGIEFGTVDPGTSNINATDNYNSGGLTQTSMSIDVSSDSNVPIDFCIRANANISTGTGPEISLVNYTFTSDKLNTFTIPESSEFSIDITTTFQKETTNVRRGESNFYRFYLDVPIGQEAGTYNNTVLIRALRIAGPCGV